MKDKALVIFSGGQDSTACLYWAKRNFGEVKAISFDYGQTHALELQAASTIAKMAEVEHEIVKVPDILKSRSPLTDRTQKLETYEDFESMDRIIGDRVELTFVPMRNALFLTIGANRAIADDIRHLVTGVCQMDNANYPDCRESFVAQQQRTINEALGTTDFVIHAPLLNLSKKETIELSMALPGCMEGMAYSHTCYAGVFPPCGVCHSCVLRAKGFELAGVPDPIFSRVK
jgi:7-cyano-7-deazaguanine synthase